MSRLRLRNRSAWILAAFAALGVGVVGRRALVPLFTQTSRISATTRFAKSPEPGRHQRSSRPETYGNVLQLEGMSLDGRRSTTHAFTGRAILLNVWATWCTACREELPGLDSLRGLYPADDLAIIGLNVDDPESAARVSRFVQDFGLSIDIWLDPEARALGQLNITSLPVTVLIDRRGREQWRRTGILRMDETDFLEQLRHGIASTR